MERLRKQFGDFTRHLASAMGEAHMYEEGSPDLASIPSREFFLLPATRDRSDWEESLGARATLPPWGPLATAYRFFVESHNESEDRFTVWETSDRSHETSREQLLVSCLVFRLKAPSLAWARRALGAVSSTDPGVSARARDERSRLLGLLDDRWSSPLGKLAITKPAPFDDVDSISALKDAHQLLVGRVKEAIVANGMAPPASLDIRLEPRWTADANEWDLNGGTRESLVSPFNPHDWSFGVEWRERGGTFGHSLTAEELLISMRREVRSIEQELGLPRDELVGKVEPLWIGDYRAQSHYLRSLPMY